MALVEGARQAVRAFVALLFAGHAAGPTSTTLLAFPVASVRQGAGKRAIAFLVVMTPSASNVWEML